MDIDYISDLHVDFWVNTFKNESKTSENIQDFVKKTLPEGKSKYLIIAGDIANRNVVTMKVLMEYKKQYEQIIVVLGNHDYYLDTKNQQQKYKKNSFNRKKELEEFLKEEKIILLENYQKVVIEGSVIAGDTNWYDSEDEEVKRINTNDHDLILKFNRAEERKKSMRNFQSLEKADLIVTHIPPILEKNCQEGYEKVYYNEMPLDKTTKWICGHIHQIEKYKVGNCEIFLNCLGYPNTFYREEVDKKGRKKIKKEKSEITKIKKITI